jgi:predicted Zn-dependent protease
MSAGRHLSVVALATLALLLPTGCASPGGEQPARPMESKDVAQSALSGFSIGGFNVGAAFGAATKAQEAFGEVSEPQEIEMGKSIAAGLLGAAPLEPNAIHQKYVNNVGVWLSVYCGRPELPWHFGIIEAPQVNAFATPGGNIFITRGLLNRIRTESELAGVLAHEMAHVVQKHHLNDIRKHAQKGLVLDLAQLRGGGGLAGEAARAVARVGLEGFIRGLSREDELEADSIGVVIAARAGYEPYGLPSVLQTLATIPSSSADMALFLKTHPSPNDRLAALEAKLPAWFETLAKPNPALVRFNQAFKQQAAAK